MKVLVDITTWAYSKSGCLFGSKLWFLRNAKIVIPHSIAESGLPERFMTWKSGLSALCGLHYLIELILDVVALFTFRH